MFLPEILPFPCFGLTVKDDWIMSKRKNESSGAGESRSNERLEYSPGEIEVHVFHPGGSIVKIRVSAKDLSATGLGFMHRGFLYDNTKCEVHLPSLLGEPEVVVGRVVRCVHREGSMHEVGLKFDKPIDPRLFTEVGLEHASINAEPMAMPNLTGRILHIDDQELDTALLKHHLKATGISLTSIQNPDDVLKAIRAEPFDVVICDLYIGDVDGEVIIQQLRDNDFQGKIIIVTAESDPSRNHRLRNMGVEEIIQKPYDPARLIGILSSILKSVGASSSEEPIYSSIPDTGEMGKLVRTYIKHTKEKVSEIKEAVEKNDIKLLRRLCLELKGHGASYGFASLTQTAHAVIQSLDASMSIEESVTAINRLISVCNRLQVKVPEKKAG